MNQTANRSIVYQHKISQNLPCNAYSMHIHDTYELIYFLDGDATHVIEDRKYKLKRGDLIIIRPLCYHFIQIDGQARYERYNILFDPQLHGVSGLDLIPDNLEVVSLEDNRVAKDVFRRCELYAQSCPQEAFAALLPALLCELFFCLHAFSEHSNTSQSTQISPLISEFLQYVNQNIGSHINIGKVAEHLFVSESYLFRLFKKELHQTPQAYIRKKRLTMARKLLLEGERPGVVCTRCGFSDYTTFYRNYVAYFGHAPSDREDAIQSPAAQQGQQS